MFGLLIWFMSVIFIFVVEIMVIFGNDFCMNEYFTKEEKDMLLILRNTTNDGSSDAPMIWEPPVDEQNCTPSSSSPRTSLIGKRKHSMIQISDETGDLNLFLNELLLIVLFTVIDFYQAFSM